MPVGAIEPDERPTGGASNIGGLVFKERVIRSPTKPRCAVSRSLLR